MENVIVVVLKAIILFKGKVLIIQRSDNDDIGANTWECVGGKLNFGEGLEEALKREVKEESNLDIDINEILYATTFNTSEQRQAVILAYLCAAHSDNVVLSSEHKDFMWADKKQMINLLGKPILNDLTLNAVWERLAID